VRDSFYAIGEATLDCVSQLWFDDVRAVEAMLRSPEYALATRNLERLVEPRYVHTLLVQEHWIIGPEPR
jgi:EthD domain-containing protein